MACMALFVVFYATKNIDPWLINACDRHHSKITPQRAKLFTAVFNVTQCFPQIFILKSASAVLHCTGFFKSSSTDGGVETVIIQEHFEYSPKARSDLRFKFGPPSHSYENYHSFGRITLNMNSVQTCLNMTWHVWDVMTLADGMSAFCTCNLTSSYFETAKITTTLYMSEYLI